MKNKLVKVICQECRGLGLYNGFMERKGEYKICWGCAGRGYVEEKIFTGRKIIQAIKKVTYRNRVGNEKQITYGEFLLDRKFK